jgi:carbamoyl-phosphate synthase small subunit
MTHDIPSGALFLADGSIFKGTSFGSTTDVSGEVVFNTGMVGYPESLTDPSYKGQILVLTYPLIGNYGVPNSNDSTPIATAVESDKIHVQGLVVSQYSSEYSHRSALKSLDIWLKEQHVPALHGVDTRLLTKRLREIGAMPGKIAFSDNVPESGEPNEGNLVSFVSVQQPVRYEAGKQRIVLIDCGCKNGIIRSLLARQVTVIRVPWNYDFLNEDFDGVIVSNGPGDPKMCPETILRVRDVIERNYPIFGICLGHQILALAAGADTFKLKYGHRSQNQPCIDRKTGRCYITSQNHGYAVVNDSLQGGWEPWLINANDGTNEGIRHCSRPFWGVQFHPEAAPGPVDTNFLFDKFLEKL